MPIVSQHETGVLFNTVRIREQTPVIGNRDCGVNAEDRS